MTLEPEKMYTAGEFAALVGVDPKTVARWAKAGQVPFVSTPAGTGVTASPWSGRS